MFSNYQIFMGVKTVHKNFIDNYTSNAIWKVRNHILVGPEKKLLENIYDLLLPRIIFPFYSPLLSSSSYYGFSFSFVCKVYPTRSAILASPLCICWSTFVLCNSSPLWLLLLFAGCIFALNNIYIYIYRVMIQCHLKIQLFTTLPM
jgi:hypothetical protein